MLHAPAVAIVLAMLCAASGHASVIVVNNLGQVPQSAGGISGGFGAFPPEAAATQFTVGSGSWSIVSVTLKILELTGNNPDQLVLRMLSDNAGTPGNTVLGTLTPTSNITSSGDYSFVPQSPITLPGGNSYWLAGFATTANASYPWWVTVSEADNGVFGWSIGTNRYASPGTVNGPWTFADDRSGMFRIEANEATPAVPEPSSFVIALGFIFASALAMRIRRRAKVF
jgi:hypothetical protein